MPIWCFGSGIRFRCIGPCWRGVCEASSSPGRLATSLFPMTVQTSRYLWTGKKRLESTIAAPAHKFSRVSASNLIGYLVSYDVLTFVPVGLLLGMIARKEAFRKPAVRFLLLLGFLLPPIFYELILVWVSGRAFSLREIILCLLLTLLGAWLMNADRSDKSSVWI